MERVGLNLSGRCGGDVMSAATQLQPLAEGIFAAVWSIHITFLPARRCPGPGCAVGSVERWKRSWAFQTGQGLELCYKGSTNIHIQSKSVYKIKRAGSLLEISVIWIVLVKSDDWESSRTTVYSLETFCFLLFMSPCPCDFNKQTFIGVLLLLATKNERQNWGILPIK